MSPFCLYGSLAFKSQYLLILQEMLEMALWFENKFWGRKFCILKIEEKPETLPWATFPEL